MDNQTISQSFGTHDGRFHADEVTACALLHLFKKIDIKKVFRTRDPLVLARCEYVCDVGGVYEPKRKIFDHHQVEYTDQLSSAGMVLKYLFDEGVIDETLFHWLDQELVHGVDAYDNGHELLGRGVATFSHVVSNFTPVSYEATPEEEDRAFQVALSFVIGHLERLIARYEYTKSCKALVKERMDHDKVCLFFDEGIPWLDAFFELGGEAHPALFVIMPSGKHWKLRGIPPSSKERMKVRYPLPHTWAGLLEEELKRKTGIPGAIFCHKGRFISVWETKNDALTALDLVLGEMR